MSPPAALRAAVALSGAAALLCEVVWMRRLALQLGSGGAALTWTLSVYMAGLGLGGLLGGALPPKISGRRAYAAAELGAAGLTLALPSALGAAAAWSPGPALALLLLPPALLHGISLPALAAADGGDRGARGRAADLYAWNTGGAMLGVALGSAVALPLLGLRGAEWLAAAGATAAALVAVRSAPQGPRAAPARPAAEAPAPPALLAAVALSGAAALAMELVWSRIGAMLLGGSVYAMSACLAAFLGGVALGAGLGRRAGRVGPGLAALALGLLPGIALARGLPHAVAALWPAVGPGGLLPAGVGLMALAMAPVPLGSGAVLGAALAQAPPGRRAAGALLAANTAGSVLGSAAAGLWALPALGLGGLAQAVAALAGLGAFAALPGRRARAGLLLGLLGGALLPGWDPMLYAVGSTLRLREFADTSPRAIEAFAHEGWALRFHEDGRGASVAVGESLRTGNRWLSLNGKVDASTGADMPTQVLSGRLPVALARARVASPEVGVVGLASGVTAAEALQAGAARVTVLEIEPAVVRAAALFADVNHGLLDDARAQVIVGDARAWLRRPGPPLDVWISEPSNPWIMGVNNLFTREYWALARARLRPDGVMCQWVQLYSLPPSAFRGLVRTFLDVFPEAWLFETIPGADALLIAAPGPLPPDLPLQPRLDPAGLRRLAGLSRRNTDADPWVEFEAPRWLHRPTAAQNAALIERAAEAP